MALQINPHNNLVSTRLLDFFGLFTPWTRRLWGVGSVLLMRELTEAAEAAAEGTLSEATTRWLAGAMKAQIGPDLGVGPDRNALMAVLNGKDALRSGGHDHARLTEISIRVAAAYLSNWAAALRESSGQMDGEAMARLVGAHMLDAGFSANFLHPWWLRRIRGNSNTITPLADVVDEAHRLVAGAATRYRVLVALRNEVALNAPLPEGWLHARGVAEWLSANGVSTSHLRQHGGLLLAVEARDPWAAIAITSDRIDRLASRVAIGLGRRFEALEHAWVEGYKDAFRLRTPRTVAVHSLDRERRVFATTEPKFIDDALELVRPLHDGPAPAAVAGGWAAIEALLSSPGDRDKVVCADRLALLVAQSFPRAELTRLAYAYAKSASDSLADHIREAPSNRDRCELVENALLQDRTLGFGNASDRIAIQHLRVLLASPYESLRSIQERATEALRRLYRVRNLVIHGARTRGVAVTASLRSAAALVGEGLDRIAHAWIVDNVEPRVLVARAHVRLDALRSGSGLRVTRLLE